jgi:hypothetical protein
MTPERVDASGISNVAAAAAKCLAPAQRSVEGVVRMRSAEDLAKWKRWAGRWWAAGQAMLASWHAAEVQPWVGNGRSRTSVPLCAVWGLMVGSCHRDCQNAAGSC